MDNTNHNGIDYLLCRIAQISKDAFDNSKATNEIVDIVASIAESAYKSNEVTKSVVYAASDAFSRLASSALSASCTATLDKAPIFSQSECSPVNCNHTVTGFLGNSKFKISFSDFIAILSLLFTIISFVSPDKTADLLEEQNQLLSDFISSATSDNQEILEYLEELKNSLLDIDCSAQESEYSSQSVPESSASQNSSPQNECSLKSEESE